MEALTRLVTDSLARHGLDRPVDPRRLQWSRWFRCDSPHSLLVVPSKPGIFALAEEIMDLGSTNTEGASNTHVGKAAPGCPAEQSSAAVSSAPTAGGSPDREGTGRERTDREGTGREGTDRKGTDCPAEQSSAAVSSAPTAGGSPDREGTGREGTDREGTGREGTGREGTDREGHDFSRAVSAAQPSPASAAGAPLGGAALQRCDSLPGMNAALAAKVPQRRMLAVLQFSEDDDMAFTLDRMFTQINPMRSRLSSGRCFLRFVVIEDQAQRRSICTALNQWVLSSAEKASGLSSDFQSSLELAPVTDRVGRTLLSDSADSLPKSAQATQSRQETDVIPPALNTDSGDNKNLHCPHPLPSGF